MIDKITDAELFVQIAINQRKMANTLMSYEAEIQRLKFRLDRLEEGEIRESPRHAITEGL